MADEQVVDTQVDAGSSTADTQDTSTRQTDTKVATPPASAGKITDDPQYRGMLADLQKERKARQDYERQATEHKTALEIERRRVQALSGVAPKSAEETDAENIRARIKAIMGPDFGSLTAAERQELQALKEQAAEIRASSERQWISHGQKMLDSVTDAIAKEMGGTLSERQRTRVMRAYVQEAEASPEFLARHEAGDPKLITEFVKNFSEDFLEPAKRSVMKTESDRLRRVPGSRDRSVVTASGKKADLLNDKDFGDALVDSFRKHGGAFGE